MPRRSPPPLDDVVLDDPKAVRALAHPARLAVIDALYSGEVLTATECAELAGITPSAMSYHLRELEKYGIVRRAPARGDGRQRPWERAGRDLQVRPAASSPAVAAAATLLIDEAFRQDRDRLVRQLALDRRPSDAGQWRRGTTYTRGRLLLTGKEYRELSAALEQLVAPYHAGARKDAPPDAEAVSATILLVREHPV